MATGDYGKLSEYDSSKKDWQSYIERLELYFTANDIDDEEKRKAILLTYVVLNVIVYSKD